MFSNVLFYADCVIHVNFHHCNGIIFCSIEVSILDISIIVPTDETFVNHMVIIHYKLFMSQAFFDYCGPDL